jgi:hypothetical protein
VAGDELLLENHSKEWDRIDIEVKMLGGRDD